MTEDRQAFREKLDSIQFAGQMRKPRVVVNKDADTKAVELVNEDTGEYGGHNTHHADGRMDCSVKARPIIARSF